MKRRLSAILLAVCMALSLLPAQAFAVDGSPAEGTVTAQKTAVDNYDDTYTITLSIQGTPITATTQSAADVILVVDNSGSMQQGPRVTCGTPSSEFVFHDGFFGDYYECPECGHRYESNWWGSFDLPEFCTGTYTQSRIDTAKKVSKLFAESILNDENNNRLGVIGFAGFWGGQNDPSALRATENLTDNLNDVEAAIDDMYASGGTNYTAALDQAYDWLNAREGAERDRPAFVVFISDGSPGSDGGDYRNTNWNGANEATDIKALGATLYTIGIDLDDTASSYLQGLATSANHYINVTGDGYAQQLADILKQWAEAINSIAAGTNAKITDVINSDYFVLDTETLPEGLTVDWANDPSGSTLVWDIGSIPANRDEVSFTIRLTEEGLANISEDGQTIFTNNDVSLTYDTNLDVPEDQKHVTVGKDQIGDPSFKITGTKPVTPASVNVVKHLTSILRDNTEQMQAGNPVPPVRVGDTLTWTVTITKAGTGISDWPVSDLLGDQPLTLYRTNTDGTLSDPVAAISDSDFAGDTLTLYAQYTVQEGDTTLSNTATVDTGDGDETGTSEETPQVEYAVRYFADGNYLTNGDYAVQYYTAGQSVTVAPKYPDTSTTVYGDWTSDDVTITSGTFIMPAQDVTLTASSSTVDTSAVKVPVDAESVTLSDGTILYRGQNYLWPVESNGTWTAYYYAGENQPDDLLYAVTVTTTAATTVTVTDAGATYVGMGSGALGGASYAGDTLTFTGPGMATLYFSKQANTDSQINNVALVNDQEIPSDPVTVVTSDDQVSVSKEVTATRDGASIDLEADGATVRPGDVLHYTITVTNTGNTSLWGVRIQDTFTGANAPADYWAKNTDGSYTYAWTITHLTVGASETISYSYEVSNADAGNPIRNTAAALDVSQDDTEDNETDTPVEGYDLTFHANGGYFGMDPATIDNVVEGLAAGTHIFGQLADYVEPTHAEATLEDGTAVAVKLVGWTTTKPTTEGHIYEAGDTDVPATVSEITLADDDEVWAVWGYDEDGDGTADVNQIVITPADIVIYTGGTGYDGVVDGAYEEGETSHGFPEPGYYITLPTNLNDALLEALGKADATDQDRIVDLSQYLVFSYDYNGTTRTWALQKYDAEGTSRVSDGRYIYRLMPSDDGSDNQIPVRLAITENGTEEIIENDHAFSLTVDQLFAEYDMKIYSGELEQSEIGMDSTGTMDLGEAFTTLLESAKVYVDTGKLTVRGVNDREDPEVTRDLLDSAPDSQVSQISAHDSTGLNYYINDSTLEVQNPDAVQLLVDTLTTGSDTAQTTLQDAATAALERAGISTENLKFSEFRYLDLVDTSNGNAYVTLGDGQTIDIYWPQTAGDTTYYVFHFDGLDRNFDLLEDGLTYQLQVYASDVPADSGFETLNTDNGNLQFSTSTFSPFVVAYVDSTPAQTYTVTYNLNGGTGTTPSSQTVTAGTSITVADGSGFSRSNHTFTGWNTASNGTGTGYTANSSMVVSSSVTLYAQWSYNGGSSTEDDEHLLKFESNGGTEFDDIGPEDHSFIVDLDDYIPSRPGYVFTGWYRQRNLTSRVSGNFTVTGVITLYAGWEESSVPSMLNGDDHFAYIQGYADGTVRPNANITRAQVATIFFRLLDPEVRDDYLTTTNSFPDVNEDYWANTAISTMAALGVINGRNSGLFDPDAPITRAEFAAICSRFDESNITGVDTFTDISGHWAEEEIQRAAALGWVQGYSDGTFHPNANITRAQAVTMINRVLCRLPEDTEDLLPGMNVWTDCDEDDWYYLAIQEATNSHDYETKDTVYESWTDLNSDPDWSQYE